MSGQRQADLDALLEQSGVVPVVVLDNAVDALPVAEALLAGGLPVVEITLRTEAALEAIATIAHSSAVVGAGTVLSTGQVDSAVDAGAEFVVSPGLHEPVVIRARELGIPLYPGIATPTEAQRAWNLGLRTVKFFPAGQSGGVAMLKALSAVYRDMRFMPTGGVSANNLADYLSLSAVIACGGSWLTPAASIAAGNFQEISALASNARDIVSGIRGSMHG